jgi:hypothetical protein
VAGVTTAIPTPSRPSNRPDPCPRPRPAARGRAGTGPSSGHPEAYAGLAREPQYATGLEICRADLAEEAAGEAPGPGPWSPCSAAAGLTEAYLAHLAAREPHADPAEEAERAYVVEQFALSHALGTCRYVPLPSPVPSPWPGHPFVGGYADPALAHGDPDGPRGGILLVAAPSGNGFLERYRGLNRAVAHWWSSDESPEAAIGRAGLRHSERDALSRVLPDLTLTVTS